MKGRIVIFSVVGCPFCIRAKGFLDNLKLPYIDINLDKNGQARKDLVERTGKKTVPQIYFNEIYVGGWDNLSKLPKEELERLIKIVEENPAPLDAPQPGDTNENEENKTDGPFDFRCELDEYVEIVKELKDGGVVGDHKKNFKTHKKSFIGKEAVDWLVKNKNLERDVAIDMCKQLIGQRFGHNIKSDSEFKDDDSIYRFLEDDKSRALNANVYSQCEPRKASDLGEDLRQLILAIYNSYLSSDGKKVDYKSIGEDMKFKAYVSRTAELHRVDVEGATREEKLAFFINIYNALVIHAFVVIGPPVNLWQRYKFFNTVSYLIGGFTYSLNDIENGILRSNRKAIGAFRRPFNKSDSRLKVALSKTEPKVHFALVCGAKSCPPIKTYSAANIDELLQLAAESFLEGDGCQVDMTKKEVKVSQILKWYKEDFGSNKQEIVQFVHDHMGACEKKTQLAELLASRNFKFSHIAYDWDLNTK